MLVYQGEELIGEGIGFGVPIIGYGDETYFPGDATVSLHQSSDCDAVVTKQFIMNIITRKNFRQVKMENRLVRKISWSLDEIYRKHKRLRMFFLTGIRGRMGVRTSFLKTTAAGNVIVSYYIKNSHVQVKVDLSDLRWDKLRKIYLLNEQGSLIFRRYSDSGDTILFDKQIGAWEVVKSKWASISDMKGNVGFKLWNVKGGILRRGREYGGNVDWIGLDYELTPTKPNFEYEIEVLGA